MNLVSIQEEMTNQNIFSLYNFENPNDEQKRISNIIYCQLISYIYNMLSMEVSKEIVKELISDFCKNYKLTEEYSSIIMKNIEEYNTKNSQSVQNSIIEDNLPLISDEFDGKNIDHTILKHMEGDVKTLTPQNKDEGVV